MINQMYMNSKQRRPRQTNSDLVRTLSPYVATAVLVVVLFWGVDSIKADRSGKKQWEPAEIVPQPPTKQRDWTQKLSTTTGAYEDKNRPDDATEESCPMPVGNWGHTCDRELVIEGPCNGKCLLKARCQDVKEKFSDTTFEYSEGRTLEIKNVNGLLCTIEDGSPSCGVNFHGNMALKNCKGYIPRRHEVVPDGKFAPPREHANIDNTKQKSWDTNDEAEEEEEEEETKLRPYRSKNYENEDFDEPAPRSPRKSRSRYEEDDWEDNTRGRSHRFRERSNKYAMDDDEDEYLPRKKSHEDEYQSARSIPGRKYSGRYDDEREAPRKSRNWDYEPEMDRRSSRRSYDDDDDDSMLRGATRRRRSRFDDDEGPARRLRGVDEDA